MSATHETLSHLKRLRDNARQQQEVALARQKQQCQRVENNVKALGLLLQKTDVSTQASSPAGLVNIAAYKGSLRHILDWQQAQKALADAKAGQLQLALNQALCRGKITDMALEENQLSERQQAERQSQKALDEIASQCWLRQHRQQGQP